MLSKITSFDRPTRSAHQHVYGSDMIAEAFRAVGMQYVAVCPGTSLRGFHDSVVNHLNNENPQLVTVLHEESAVAIAHGYAKVTGKAMGVMAHANVGLLHASMAVFNAWCDRVPMIVIGGVGPLDASKRRAWIDWIHTSQDLGNIVRDFTKWDDRPASVVASVESIRRAWTISHTLPQGPTYLNFDWELQETVTETPPSIPPILKDPVPVAGPPPRAVLEEIGGLLGASQHPLLLVGRVEADSQSWRDRIALAERFGMRVLTDIKARAGFPTSHPLHGPGGGLFLSDDVFAEFDKSDFILSLDWIDLGTMTNRTASAPRLVVNVSADQAIHRGSNADYQVLPTVDWHFSCAPAVMVEALLAEFAGTRAGNPVPPYERVAPTFPSDMIEITMPFLGETLKEVLRSTDASLVRVPLRWHQDWIDAESALDYLGYDGGFGLGSGPGMLVGAALALQGTGRLAVAVLGDGDTLMGGTAFWTAAHYKLPMLAVIANNASFYTDELHQERVARERSRPTSNKWIGQAISEPIPDLAAFARALGISGVDSVARPDELKGVLVDAVRRAAAGEAILVDIRVHGS